MVRTSHSYNFIMYDAKEGEFLRGTRAMVKGGMRSEAVVREDFIPESWAIFLKAHPNKWFNLKKKGETW